MTELRKQQLQSDVNAGNSSLVPLGAGATFMGASVDLSLRTCNAIRIAFYSDVDSAVKGVEIQFSVDNSTWRTTDAYSYFGGTGPKIVHHPRIYRYFRLRFTNGAALQTVFELETTLHTEMVAPWSHKLEEDLSPEDDAGLTKAIIAAQIPLGVFKNVNATAAGALQVHIGEENSDSFGRVRVSDPVALLDSTFAANLNPRVFEDISSGNGSVVYNTNGRYAQLAVAAGAPGVAGLQSYQYTHYNPGKSHLIFMTECADPDNVGFVAGQKVEAGYFDDANGIFARVDDTGLHAVRRSSTSGAPVDEVVDSADFSIDPLDGTGPSGLTVDPTKSQILVMDLQFLGVGRVRMGLEVAGSIVYAHEFNFANSEPGMYMQSGSLPVRWRLEDTGATGFANNQAYCCMVSSEGGAEENRGIPLVTGVVPPGVTVGTTEIPIISIRPGLLFNGLANRIWNILESALMMNTGNNEVIARLWYDPTTLTGAAFAAVDASDSGMEVDVAATAITVGTGVQIDEFYAPASVQSKSEVESALKSRLPIALNAAGTGRVGTITLTAQAVTATSTVFGAIKWREVR